MGFRYKKVVKILVTTVPFAENNSKLLKLISSSKLEIDLNPFGRKMSYQELGKILPKYDGVIAGTDRFDKVLLQKCSNLLFISRVGVGTDNIDHEYAKKEDIKIFSTPDEPSNAVAELTIGLSISLLRGIAFNNDDMKQGIWKKKMGKSICEVNFGIFGFGRIGKKVFDHLNNLGCKNIFICDPYIRDKKASINFMEKDELLKSSDIVSLHLPLSDETQNFIGKKEIKLLQNGSYIINTSRGGLIDHKSLVYFLKNKKLGGAAIDVYDEEPYSGELTTLNNTITTSHIGPMTEETRKNMESKAVQNIINFYN